MDCFNATIDIKIYLKFYELSISVLKIFEMGILSFSPIALQNFTENNLTESLCHD